MRRGVALLCQSYAGTISARARDDILIEGWDLEESVVVRGR